MHGFGGEGVGKAVPLLKDTILGCPFPPACVALELGIWGSELSQRM